MSESIELSKPPMSNYLTPNRNQRPPLLPTPARSMNGPDDIETVDMEMSDDDTGMDNRSVGSSGGESLSTSAGKCFNFFRFSDHREFSMSNMFPLPIQINMNRPPPPLMQDGDMNQQRKSWIHNQGGNDSMSDDGGMNQMSEAPPSLLGIAPPNFMPRNNFQGAGNFRGNRGNRGGANNSPYNNNFRGGRGSRPPRGRGFRGNFKGQGQW